MKRRHTSSKGRVLLVVENITFPNDPRVRREAEVLLRNSYDVSVVAPHRPGESWYENVRGAHVYRYPDRDWRSGVLSHVLEYAWSTTAILVLSVWVAVRRGVDVVHVANPPDLLFLIGAFFRLCGKKFVYDHHDLCPELFEAQWGKRYQPIVRALRGLEILSCRLADHIITTNTSHREIEMQRSGVSAEHISIVRNGPEPDWASRWLWNSPPPRNEKAILGYAGVIGFQDGVDCLVQAVRHLRYELGRTDFLCAIVGDGPALESVKVLARQLRVEDHIQFKGWVADPREYVRFLNAADICLSPEPSNPYNDHSTFLKVLQYMCVGKPIVAFDLLETRRSAGSAAVYAPNNDVAAYSNSIAELIDDHARRKSMGEIGSRRIQEQLNWTHSAAALLTAYEKVFSSATETRTLQQLRNSPLPGPRANVTAVQVAELTK